MPSLSDALRIFKDQAIRTPPPQWVRVVGGWSEFQFAERRMPTLQEINDAAPDTPVFVLHLYVTAILRTTMPLWEMMIGLVETVGAGKADRCLDRQHLQFWNPPAPDELNARALVPNDREKEVDRARNK